VPVPVATAQGRGVQLSPTVNDALRLPVVYSWSDHERLHRCPWSRERGWAARSPRQPLRAISTNPVGQPTAPGPSAAAGQQRWPSAPGDPCRCRTSSVRLIAGCRLGVHPGCGPTEYSLIRMREVSLSSRGADPSAHQRKALSVRTCFESCRRVCAVGTRGMVTVWTWRLPLVIHAGTRPI